jgi:hypothetical protein
LGRPGVLEYPGRVAGLVAGRVDGLVDGLVAGRGEVVAGRVAGRIAGRGLLLYVLGRVAGLVAGRVEGRVAGRVDCGRLAGLVDCGRATALGAGREDGRVEVLREGWLLGWVLAGFELRETPWVPLLLPRYEPWPMLAWARKHRQRVKRRLYFAFMIPGFLG